MWCLERNKGFRGPEGDEDSSSPSFSDAEEQEFFSREAECAPKPMCCRWVTVCLEAYGALLFKSGVF